MGRLNEREVIIAALGRKENSSWRVTKKGSPKTVGKA